MVLSSTSTMPSAPRVAVSPFGSGPRGRYGIRLSGSRVSAVLSLDGLLDDERLNGLHPITRELAPEQQVAAVDTDDLDDAVVTIEQLCTLWGGGCGGLLPVR